jgi:hypothetical protein
MSAVTFAHGSPSKRPASDQNVDVAGGFGHCVGADVVGQVADDGDGVTTDRPDARRDGRRALGVAAVHHRRRALCGQRLRDGLAQAGARTADQRPLAR